MSLIILALIIGLAMSTSLMAGGVPYSGGTGTNVDPYQIANKDELLALCNTSADWGAYFKQTFDIAFVATDFESGGNFYNSGAGFSPIGNGTIKFTGNYDGDGHSIDGLFINRSGTSYIGLFGYTSGATVQNLGVTNVNITGQHYVGGLVGYNYNFATVSNSYSTGDVTGNQKVGGLVGYNCTSATVSNSYSTCDVTGDSNVGGLVGYNYYSSPISNSYSTGSVSGTSYVGGLVGYNSSATVSNSFWDVETDGIDGSSSGDNNYGATGKTTAEMKTQSTFTDADWNFTTIWEMIGSNYPRLQSNQDASLPVELTAFTAECRSGGVLLKWCTESEIENLGFIIEKRKQETGDWKQVADYLTDSDLEGHGSTTEAHEYQFTDKTVQPGVTYEYRLGDVDYNGKVTWHGKIEIKVKIEGAKIPTEFGLQSAYPNPFNPSTTISYQLASASFVKISIYDVGGKLVETLVDEQKERGSYSVVWDAGGLSSGIYFYKLSSSTTNITKKMLLMK